jgi:hypothetical protein
MEHQDDLTSGPERESAERDMERERDEARERHAEGARETERAEESEWDATTDREMDIEQASELPEREARRREDAESYDPATAVDHLTDASPTTGEVVGEGVGGITGTLAGAAIGSLGGPIGTVIGAIAGAAGGWWAGRAVAEAAQTFDDHDGYYSERYMRSEARPLDRPYDLMRPAFQLGHVARHNPDYINRPFDEIEPELRRGWTDDLRMQYGEWEEVRPFAKEAYTTSDEQLTEARERTHDHIEARRHSIKADVGPPKYY